MFPMGYRRLWGFGWYLGLAVLLVAGTGANGQNRGSGASWLTAAVTHDGYANDVGHYLAGLAVAPNSPLAQFEDNAAWATHQHDLDEAWGQMENE